MLVLTANDTSRLMLLWQVDVLPEVLDVLFHALELPHRMGQWVVLVQQVIGQPGPVHWRWGRNHLAPNAIDGLARSRRGRCQPMEVVHALLDGIQGWLVIVEGQLAHRKDPGDLFEQMQPAVVVVAQHGAQLGLKQVAPALRRQLARFQLNLGQLGQVQSIQNDLLAAIVRQTVLDTQGHRDDRYY